MTTLRRSFILKLADGSYRTSKQYGYGAGTTTDVRKAKVYTTLGSLRGAITYHGIKGATVLEVSLTITNEFPA